MNVLRKIYSLALDTVQTLILAAALFLVVYVFIFRPFQVSGESMYPNFLNKEYVLTNIIGLRFAKPKLGDIIVFKSPTDEEKDFVKRVIGVSGDTVMAKDGNVYLNDKLLDESKYLKPTVKTYGGSFLKEGETVTVPNNQYFVLGDNRPYSSDSREWGFVPEKLLIGQSFLVYWPLNDMKFVKNSYQ